MEIFDVDTKIEKLSTKLRNEISTAWITAKRFDIIQPEKMRTVLKMKVVEDKFDWG